MPGSAPVNVGDPELEYALYEAERRVRGIQAKLHRWAGDDPHRRFDDLSLSTTSSAIPRS